MKKNITFLAFLLVTGVLKGQVVNTGVMDTADFAFQGRVTVGGYIDSYYGYDFNKPASGDRPYFVSMARHNELTINLAYVDVVYTSSRLRARIAPGFGTYMNSNYAAEPGALKNIVEGSIGIKVSKTKDIWIEAGILGSPFTNESAISKDQLMYSRSYAAEYSPYYLSGVKLSMPLDEKTNLNLYLINGWQQIADQNNGKSIATQLQFQPSQDLMIDWNIYAGDERSSNYPDNRMRYFTDFHFGYTKGKVAATGCVYAGIQQSLDGNNSTRSDTWWQANLNAQYGITKKVSLSGRVEYFNDPKNVQVVPITNVSGFSTYSTGLCLNLHIASNIVARCEGRTFFSEKEVYEREGNSTQTSNLLISNLTIWF